LAIQDACLELGIKLQFCPAKRPEYKGAIERFLRTFNHGLIHRLPGTVFSSPVKRGDYPAEQETCIDIDTLTHLVTKWIVEIYHQAPHRGIGTTPMARWITGAAARLIEHPAEPAQLGIILSHMKERTVFHYGIEVHGLLYNGSGLQDLRKRHGDPLKIKCKNDIDDLGSVHYFDPDQRAYLRIDAIDQQYACGLRLVQHKLIQAHIRSQNQDPTNQNVRLAKKHELQEIIADALRSKKMLHRKKARVISGLDRSELQEIRRDRPTSPPVPKTFASDTLDVPALLVKPRGSSLAGGDAR
ncbi:MAG: Mu transposase C-terminal domain-containing protein, partial [Desulforhabdus sp.]|nr:Mu transposase C-terminal domain-containing protein [Desulforhabdus sp.]